MTELRVMAVTGDGDRLVLRAHDGQEFFLPIDDRLRAAVRGDRARLGQIEIEMDAQLRPRDIQARIRAGQTAEQVADNAGIPLERVRRFEGPVLAERAFMAERAQNTQVRRSGETHGPKLGDVVRDRLMQRGIDHDSAQWDSWRKDDGIWTVRLLFRIGGVPYEAVWTFDPPRRLVTALDDESRLLSSDVVADNAFPFAARPTRLPAASGESGRSASVTSLPTWHGAQRSSMAGSAADSVVTPLRPAAAAAGAPAASAAEESAVPAGRQPGAGSAYTDLMFPKVGPHKDRLTGQTDQQAVNDGVSPGKRATVPTWDEIVFGSRRKKG
jgi:Protein of unknown function (DUF3071)